MSSGELKLTKKLMCIHKVMIEMEKGAYYRRREKAQVHPDIYMSMIADGMSQGHTTLPWKANKTDPKNKLALKIQGVKQHGFSKALYMIPPFIPTGTDLALTVIVAEIMKRMQHCLDKDIPFPTTLFLQVDGGSENASKAFYGFMEYLVREKVFKRIEVTRLPVGHTHEDIDAMFGTLWRHMQSKTIITPQQWQAAAFKCFNAGVRPV